jgi:hypothetical protein
VVSVTALLISVLNYRSSRDAKHHTQIVTFEQRKQEVRQTLFEGQLLFAEITKELNQFENPTNASKNRGRKPSESHADPPRIIYYGRSPPRQQQNLLQRLDKVSPSASTEDRLLLEELGGLSTHEPELSECFKDSQILKRMAEITQFTSK